ncbi:MAG: peptide chain release factor N(5)-glutamine methyltransferase [Bacteroidetes bacterium]|nr:peptide chain release factor N(5)-glutamine methyltransferase [Bacteroidota bacterium]
MKVPSNRLSDVMSYYARQLSELYDAREAVNIVREIIRHFLGIDRMAMALEPDLRISESEMLEVHFAVKEVRSGRPLQYVTGVAWFDGHPFAVNEAVLIPRQETEGMLMLASGFIGKRDELKALDACTGSGCIAVSMKLRHPSVKVWASDVSLPALEQARQNAVSLGAEVEFIHQDLLNPGPDENAPYDLILSNPPYVPESEKNTLAKHVLAEPALALFVPDASPLIFYHALAKLATTQLQNGGMLAVECHSAYASDVAELFKEAGLADVRVHEDHHGRERFVVAFQNYSRS